MLCILTGKLGNVCYQFRILHNLRIDIKDRLEEHSQSIEIDIHACTQSQKKLIIYGDLHPKPEVVRNPQFKVPYPISNRDNNI